MTSNFAGYQKLTVFTKDNPEEDNVFPNEKVAIYRSYNYKIHTPVYNSCTSEVYKLSYTSYKNELLKRKCEEFARLFFGAEGFEYDCTYAINPINTVFIVILDYITERTINIFAKEHKNFVLFCLISTSSPHQIFIGLDLRMNKDSDYQKKIEELKFLLGIEEVNDYL
ncbi:MAG: hypothetical protein IJO78_04040 [Erysipelotrichaceae bacterium]|nr:hypothetical protein [Erysipelotrichaceae bacterium]